MASRGEGGAAMASGALEAIRKWGAGIIRVGRIAVLVRHGVSGAVVSR